MSSKFGWIRPQTTYLAALERLKKPHRLIMGKITSSRFLGCFDWILFILTGNENMHKSLDEYEFQQDSTTDYRVSCPEASKNDVTNFSRLLSIPSLFFKLVGNKDMHNILDKFKFRPDRTSDYRVNCH